MMVTGFRNVSDVYRFLHATVHEAEPGLEEGTLSFQTEGGEYAIDLEYVSASVTSLSHRFILSYRFLSRGDIFDRFASAISTQYPHLLMTHLVSGSDNGDLHLRQIRGGKVTYNRKMPAIVGSAVINELESEPQQEDTLTFHLRDLVDMTESAFVDHLSRLRTPVFSEMNN
jgi:hypothetical protein